MANAAVVDRRLGGRARACRRRSAVPPGRDLTGDAILRSSSSENIDHSRVVRVDGMASSISAILDQSRRRAADRQLSRRRRWPTRAAQIPTRSIASADAVLIDNRFPEFVAADRARRAKARQDRAAGCATIRRAMTDALLDACTHIVFSADGLRATAQIAGFRGRA